MKIKPKLVILFLLISLIPLLVVNFLSYNSFKTEITNKTVDQLTATAAKQEQRLNTILQQDRERVINLSNMYELRVSLEKYLRLKNSADGKVVNGILAAESSNLADVSIYITNATGTILASTDANIIGDSFSNEEDFLQNENDNVYTLAEDKKEQTTKLFITNKIMFEGRPLGLLIMSFPTDELFYVIQDYTGLGKTGETELAKLDSKGNAVFLTPLRFDSEAAFKRTVNANEIHSPIILSFSKIESVYTDAVDYRGQNVLAATKYIDLAGWGMTVKIDRAEALAPIDFLRNDLLIVFLISSFAVALIAFYFSEVFTAPIVALTKITQKIIDGDLNQKIYISSSDEIGLLAGTFNQMTKKLAESYHALEEKVRERTAELAKKLAELARNNTELEELDKKLKAEKANTEQKVTDRTRELREEQARLTASINSLSLGFLLTDTKNNVLIANPAIETIFNLPHSNWTLDDMQETLQNSVNLSEQAVKAKKEKKIIAMEEIAFKGKFLRMLFSPITMIRDHEEIIGTVILVEDITEAKILERSREEFFSIASHELKTPLTAIRGNISLIRSYYTKTIHDPEVLQMLDDIENGSVRLIKIVNDFLNVSRFEQGRITMKVEALSLPDIIEETIKGVKELASEKKLILEFEKTSDSLPPIKADRDRVKEVLLNLIGNAINYTTQGGIKVRMEKQEHFMKVFVSDTGVGIPLEYQSLLFHKFQQAAPNILTRSVAQGTGLGLYISKLMVEAMGGTIKLEKSVPDGGTTFSFTLPLAN